MATFDREYRKGKEAHGSMCALLAYVRLGKLSFEFFGGNQVGRGRVPTVTPGSSDSEMFLASVLRIVHFILQIF
ncbi:hypothetical protein EVAR_94729_1 [Eumeta japonica]|uniref:Uncharacterized protein n=1 Tax=Eumeta variegata TaxID=151549 RepID=A0A4C1UW85_EUMVA|nr:hypothetical protein EVAR_94729_1 [Eumeta japonica]